MKKLIALTLVVMMLASLAACARQQAPAAVVGGWTPAEGAEMTEEAQAAFDKAMEGLVGVNYTPLALLGTQLVAGTNYCLLCEAAVVYPGAEPYYALVYVYADLQGGAAIRDIVPLDIAALSQASE